MEGQLSLRIGIELELLADLLKIDWLIEKLVTMPKILIYLVIYLVWPPGEITPSEAYGQADLVHEEAHHGVPNLT